MLSMHQGIKCLQVSALCVLFTVAAPHANPAESGLTLAAAEALAKKADPGVRAVEASRLALEERSVADGQLPDPMLKLGLTSLPTDSFNLGQEPMTQVQFGLVQEFPRGDTRTLRSAQTTLKSESLHEVSRDKSLQVALAVREQFLEVLKQQELARINAEAIASFSDVADITEAYYATGRVQQHDVLQAAVEVAKVEERAARISQDEERARARLSTWIGEAAYGVLDGDWPALTHPPGSGAIKEALSNHPRVLALQKRISAAETGVELARQRYKPGFSLDVTYGGRTGTNPDGSSRTDLLSVMAVMDIPLFTGNRQDRIVAAQVAESSAATFDRDDVLRRLYSEVDFQAASFQRQRERLGLYEEILLPEASFSSETSLEAYQSSVGDLTTLLLTRITELNLQLEYARLKAETLKTWARLQYLEGV